LKMISNGVPLGTLGTPDEIAKAVVFLASDDAATSQERNCLWMVGSHKCSCNSVEERFVDWWSRGGSNSWPPHCELDARQKRKYLPFLKLQPPRICERFPSFPILLPRVRVGVLLFLSTNWPHEKEVRPVLIASNPIPVQIRSLTSAFANACSLVPATTTRFDPVT